MCQASDARLGTRATLIKADAAALPFGNATFTRVYCTEVLEHVLSPRNVLAEISRVLTPDGIAVVSIPNEALINDIKRIFLDNPVGRLVMRENAAGYHASKKMDDEWHLHSFDLALLREVCDGIFEIERLVPVPHPAIPIRYVARLKRT